MANNQPAKKKRRIRPSSETVRERANKANQAVDKQPKTSKASKKPRRVAAPLRAIAQPFKWLGRHIIPRYFKDAFSELANVTWPARKQSRQLTTAVLAFAVVFGFFVSVLDYGFDKIFKKVFLHE